MMERSICQYKLNFPISGGKYFPRWIDRGGENFFGECMSERRIHGSLRLAILAIQKQKIVCFDVVAILAATEKFTYLSIRKLLSRIFRESNLKIDKWKMQLKQAWHNAKSWIRKTHTTCVL